MNRLYPEFKSYQEKNQIYIALKCISKNFYFDQKNQSQEIQINRMSIYGLKIQLCFQNFSHVNFKFTFVSVTIWNSDSAKREYLHT